MKKIYFTYVSLLFIPFVLSSQTTRSNLSIGGFFSTELIGGKVDNEDITTTSDIRNYLVDDEFSLRISPYCLINVNDRFLYGFKFDYSYYQVNSKINALVDNQITLVKQKATRNSYGIGFLIRSYIISNNPVEFFIQPELDVIYAQSKRRTSIPSGSTNHFISFGAGIRPGISYELSQSWNIIAMTGVVAYSYIIDKSKSADSWNSTHNIDATLSLSSFRLGLEYQF